MTLDPLELRYPSSDWMNGRVYINGSLSTDSPNVDAEVAKLPDSKAAIQAIASAAPSLHILQCRTFRQQVRKEGIGRLRKESPLPSKSQFKPIVAWRAQNKPTY
ncbi:hypothetical protein TNCT_211311 [Trichonephila clavata]|uniref:Uncharacterized protein n=1 Tax=Trichonephila clavata TaxID=2740835 RepID=A0A8X6K8K2_TRICU|nr:hypothetical protein TNCT_211311 [Trichonephila clavata]